MDRQFRPDFALGKELSVDDGNTTKNQCLTKCAIRVILRTAIVVLQNTSLAKEVVMPENPTDYIYVPVSIELWHKIEDAYEDIMDGERMVPAIHVENALELDLSIQFHENEAADEAATKRIEKFGRPHDGYQWQAVLLRNGSELRMTYQSEDHFARVVHGRIIYEDDSYSPSELSRKIANNTSRNAWRDLWVRENEAAEWQLADDLRRRNRK